MAFTLTRAQRSSKEKREERGDRDPSPLFPVHAVHRDSGKTHSVFCNTDRLWIRVKERIMAAPAAITLPNPFLMWDLQRLSWTGE